MGSHSIKAFQERGYDVVNFDIKAGYDLLNLYDCLRVIEKGDIVLHEAAIAQFSVCDANPYLAYQVNVRGTENIVRACEEREAARLIYASTGSCYMPIERPVPITEDFPVKGNSVYAVTKNFAEKAVQRGRTPWLILRYAHLYGAGKIGHGAIGGFIDKMNKREPPVIFGGRQSNDFTSIKDVVQANIKAVESPLKFEAFNIGTGVEMTTIDVFEKLATYFNYHVPFEMKPAREVDPGRFVYDITKARKMLGYEPQYDFMAGMKDWLV